MHCLGHAKNYYNNQLTRLLIGCHNHPVLCRVQVISVIKHFESKIKRAYTLF